MNKADDFQTIIVKDLPLIDVRAPIEFVKGALPGAVNLPILDDEERRLVGIRHKQKGGADAIALAKSLVAGSKKKQRTDSWIDYAASRPGAILYCARGGRRSEFAREWFVESSGQDINRLQGGYKAFRNFLIARLNPSTISARPVILGGRTGSGKTIILNRLTHSIDLEEIAHHRGSSFGRFLTDQPTQVDFENRLAAELVKHGYCRHKHLIVEDEGRHIGKRFLPKPLGDFFAGGQLVVLETSLDKRARITFDEYVIGGQQAYRDRYGGDAGLLEWYAAMEESGERIGRRFGGENLRRMKEMLTSAHRQQLATGDPSRHIDWVRMLISEYYDPMYDYQLEKDSRKVVFRGEEDAVLEFLQALG